jgi:SAM-dependent methyltransferase
MLRHRVLRYVTRYVPAGSSILEIGAGTGEDAYVLQSRGYFVTATDAAPGMARQASAKLGSIGIHVHTLPAEAAADAFPGGSFDAVFSNFGALNCVADLPGLLLRLAELLKPGGTMILCLLGKFSLWEMASGCSRLRFGLAFRRLSPGPVTANVGEHRLPVWYHSVGEIRNAGTPALQLVDRAGLNVISPPPGATALQRILPGVVRVLDRADAAIERFPVLGSLGDHVLVVFRKLDTGGTAEPRSHER